jgi:hypothetical protein
LRCLGGSDRNGTGEIRFNSNAWLNTAAITSMTFQITDGGNSIAISGINFGSENLPIKDRRISVTFSGQVVETILSPNNNLLIFSIPEAFEVLHLDYSIEVSVSGLRSNNLTFRYSPPVIYTTNFINSY